MAKICILHDYFDAVGGGEKLVMTIARALSADIVTTNLNRESISKMDGADINISSIGRNLNISPFKPMCATLWYWTCDLKDRYDLYIVSGDWAHFAAFHNRPNIYYCHTPIRAFYDMKDSNIARQKRAVMKVVSRVWIRAHTWLDQRSMRRIDHIVVNSKNVQGRVRRYYNRDSEIIYPPVPTSKFKFKGLGDFYLSVNRIYPEKRIDLQCEIFRNLPNERLKVVGGVAEGDERNLKQLDPPKNVEFLGEVNDRELADLYSECRAFIATAIDEDFGMTPVEAMASGKCVLAVDEGGFKESVIDGGTGWLLPADRDAFIAKIRSLSNDDLEQRVPACQARAREFDESIFVSKMRGAIDGVLASHGRSTQHS